MNINSKEVSKQHENPQLSGIICYKHFINRVHHCDFLKNDLPDKSANLIIADFPYFEVKGEFDFIWNSFEEFLAWVELCAKEFKRLLKENGTLFVYGHAKKIAYKQVIFDKYFNLENNLCIEFNRQTKKGVENFRCFAPVTERCLMYSNEIEKTGLQTIMNDCELFKPIRDYFENERKKTKLSYKEINELCFFTASNGGGMASNILTAYKDGWTFPTQEKYEALQKIGICLKPYEQLRQEYEQLRQEYEQLRQEYEQLRRPFNNFLKLFDVMKFDQEAHITKQYEHDTCKPETLTRALILTCSRENDLVLVPFAGSGTECAMAKKEKRNFIGFDINPEYVEMSNKRCNAIQSGLF